MKWSWSMSLGSLAPLRSDPLPDVSRATQQLDAVPFMRGEKAHRREIHECRLRQVEREPWTVALHLRLQLDQVILVDLPTEQERRRLSVGGDFDLESHRSAFSVFAGYVKATRRTSLPCDLRLAVMSFQARA